MISNIPSLIDSSIRISCNWNSDLFIFSNSNKARTVQYIPYEDDFIIEVNKIQSNTDPLILPYTEHAIFAKRRDRVLIEEMKEANDKKQARHIECLKNQYFSNEIIKKYLMRREVLVNRFGVPRYTKEEITIYDLLLEQKPPSYSVPCRRVKTNPLSGEETCDAFEALMTEICKDPNLSKTDHSSPLHNVNIFNFCGIGFDDSKLILKKNKKQLHNYLSTYCSTELEGIHYIDEVLSLSDIQRLCNNIVSKKTKLAETKHNIFICNLTHRGHATCGALLINSENINNPAASELFVLDSEMKKEDAEDRRANHSSFLDTFNKEISDHGIIKLSYIYYNVQVDSDTNDYDKDYNCSFYSISAMNALVKILGFSKGSALSLRFFGNKGFEHIDSEEDMTIYAQELAKGMPEYFDYNSETATYEAKSFEDRKRVNISYRWYLGSKFLKKEIAKHCAASESGSI